MGIANIAPQLLIAYEYDQALIDGPPFSISAEEIKQRYGADYAITALEIRDVEGGMKGKAAAIETAWLLRNNDAQ
jgi:thiopurine S-methyltransferase